MDLSGSSKGNNPELWNKLLQTLDDKLQLGLLDYLKRIESYHFEGEVLYIQPGSEDDEAYLIKDPVFQQLELLAQDATGITSVKIERIE